MKCCEILILVERFFMSLTLSGKNILAANYFPAIDLSNGNYELGLVIFETYHTISNVNKSNKLFAKDDAEITIPEGTKC